MRVRCKKCRRQFTRPRGSNRLNCYSCRPARIASPPERPKIVDGETCRLVRLELEKLQLLETMGGALVLRLARTLDDPDLAPPQVVSIVDRLYKTMELIKREAPRPPDVLDEFTQRLQERNARA